MHVHEMSERMTMFLAECSVLAERKNHDYHPDGVAYLEILRTACETNITVEQDLWGRVRKQLSALRRYVIDGKVESEPPRSRMMDIANYMAILAVWDERKPQIIADAVDFVAGTSCEQLNSNPDRRSCYELPFVNKCDRCHLLSYLVCLLNDSDLPAPKSPQTPKPPA